jgi:hypothetical protein
VRRLRKGEDDDARSSLLRGACEQGTPSLPQLQTFAFRQDCWQDAPKMGTTSSHSPRSWSFYGPPACAVLCIEVESYKYPCSCCQPIQWGTAMQSRYVGIMYGFVGERNVGVTLSLRGRIVKLRKQRNRFQSCLAIRACSHYCKVLLLILGQDGDHRSAV